MEAAALEQVSTNGPETSDGPAAELDQTLVPAARQAILTQRELMADDPEAEEKLSQIRGDLDQYEQLRRAAAGTATGSAEDRAARVAALFDRMTGAAEDLRAIEAQEAIESGESALSTYRSIRWLLGVGARRVLPGRPDRRAAAGPQPGAPDPAVLPVRGGGGGPAAHRAQPAGHGGRRPQRNNSENRLEAATTLTPGSSLVSRLVGAEPRSCLALRFGRTHREDPGRPPLPSCELCVDPGSRLTCEQLLVGGQVIGSVLVTHQQPLEEDQETLIKNSVAQAAPVLANLRNLAWPSSAPTTTR